MYVAQTILRPDSRKGGILDQTAIENNYYLDTKCSKYLIL